MKRRSKRTRRAKGTPGGGGAKSPFPRLHWSRSPVQKPHSTKKGKHGYSRKASREELSREVDDADRQ